LPVPQFWSPRYSDPVSLTEPRRLRADAARNRQALIDAAQRLFATRGLSVTLDDIAVEAGVNVATAYRHFANKRELLGAFVQQKIAEAVTIAEEAAAVDDPWQGLTAFFTRSLDLMTSSRGVHDLFAPGFAADELEKVDEQLQRPLRRLLKRAQQAGLVRRDVVTDDLGVLLQVLAAAADISSTDSAKLLRRYLQLILDGLRPAATRLPGAPPTSAEVRAAATAPSPRSR
jgi:AcrR family transcriptional regulator